MFKYTKIVLIIGLVLGGCTSNPNLMTDKNKYDVNGYDKNGFDANGYDKNGFDANGFYKDGLDVDTYDVNGFNKDGYDVKGFNKSGFDVNGFNKYGYNVKGFDKDGYNVKGLNKDGLTKQKVLSIKLGKLIKTNSDIKKIFNKNVKLQVKDKYESDAEYNNRMKDIKFSEYAVMEIDVTTEYNANEKEYKVYFDTNSPYYMLQNKIENGILDDLYNRQTNVNFGVFSLSDKDESESLIYTDIQSNAYGHKVKVTNYTRKEYVIYPDNLRNLLLKNDFKKYSKELSKDINYYLSLQNVDRKKAIFLDKSKLKLKAKVKFDDVLDLYRGSFVASATISKPSSLFNTYYFFKGHLEEFILYNEKTKEILFSYID